MERRKRQPRQGPDRRDGTTPVRTTPVRTAPVRISAVRTSAVRISGVRTSAVTLWDRPSGRMRRTGG